MPTEPTAPAPRQSVRRRAAGQSPSKGVRGPQMSTMLSRDSVIKAGHSDRICVVCTEP